MTNRHLISLILCLTTLTFAASARDLSLSSPDGKLKVDINTDSILTYTVSYDGKTLVSPSVAAMILDNGKTIGRDMRISKIKRESIDRKVPMTLYRANEADDRYNQLAFNVDKEWQVTFRAYDDAVAYRFSTTARQPFNVVNEIVSMRFPGDIPVAAPYVNAKDIDSFEPQFSRSFENIYTTCRLSELDKRRLSFLPLVVTPSDDIKVLLTEADLIDYPGLYLNNDTQTPNSLDGVFAPYPKTLKQGGHNNLQMLVTERESHIAHVDRPRSFPWRVMNVAPDDVTLASSNISYLLAEPSRIADTSWIKPGKVAWDWWNNWNIDGVDFVSGINNETYKYYIDFASENGIEYVILDEGWAVNLQADLFQVVPEIDLKELVDYASSKNVGIILWAGYHAFDRDMEKVCRHYADMGVKGFKVDFMDRDDQIITDFNARAAEMCAKYNLVLDLHGTSKPAGLNRTYPNILNFEGVHGLEQMKWNPASVDQIEYDVMIPFIRQSAGPMDYTQGAMNNATGKNYYPCYSEPMSRGTRCRQLAMYMIYDSPLNMLCDPPSNYMRNQECTDFIAAVPTTWDETIVLDGKMGDYIITARRKGDDWYIGGLTDNSPRDLKVDLRFLNPATRYKADIYADGVNAHRAGRDYRRSQMTVNNSSTLDLHLAPGGGFAIHITKLR